ncbi:DUF2271 domain-containing protein [Tissierella creatinini]|nr:DUF2271 domain-containing protein [Tissierella creatinini]TJX58022.1 DUF2271 domain-containing protein [Soehngenia saccharolytica]
MKKMIRRKIFFPMLFVVSCAAVAIVIFSQLNESCAAGVGVLIDGSPVVYSQDSGQPFIDSANRTQVPLRATMEQFGAAVTWNSKSRTATVQKNGITVKVPIGKNYIYKDDELISNDTVATIKAERTYLPIRVVLEAFGARVDWNRESQEVLVTSVPVRGNLKISFDFNWQETAGSQYAIWIEDSKGNFVRTVFATDFTKSGGYKFRKESLPLWVAKSGLANMEQPEIDAISGATPGNGRLTYTWDGTDSKGNPVPAGAYRFYLEGTLYWSEQMLCSGSFVLGGDEQKNIPLDIKYINDIDVNKNMIQNITASYLVN